MMPVLPIFETLQGFVLATAAAGGCPDVPAPRVAVLTQRQPTEIHQTLSQAQLKDFKTASDLPLQMNDLSHVETGGLMRGDIDIGYEVDFGTTPATTGDSRECVRYKDITVTLTIKPNVYIATDYEPSSCWYHEILQHEESHVDMDQNVIDKYSKRMEDGLKLAFSLPNDSIKGPVEPGKSVDVLKKTMGGEIVSIVDVMVADMARERAEKQRSVDSFGGYAYIMNTCYQGDTVIDPDP